MTEDGTDTAEMSIVELVKIRKALADNGYSSSFLRRHPGLVFTIAVTFVTLVWGAIQWYSNQSVVRALEARDTAEYRNATSGEIQAVQKDVGKFKQEARKAHRVLAHGIKSVGDLQLEQARDQRKLLGDLAESQRIDVQPKEPELEAAEEAVRAGPQLDKEPEEE